MLPIQNIIHKLEEGGGIRYLKWALLALAVVVLTLSYNMRGFHDMSNPEAMDMAQLARNIAEHKGYTTYFVRPFSMYLLQRAYADKHGPAPIGDTTDRSQIRGMHPDIVNPPVYPTLLAGFMKVFPGLRYEPAGQVTFNIGKKHINLWNSGGNFWIYPPDFWISLFNQVLLLVMAALVFFLARRLFDSVVAWTSAALFLGTDLFWQFSISGLSTILVMLIFLVLAWCLMVLESGAREAKLSNGKLLALAACIGALTGIGCLTRYSFGWLVIPVLLFLVLFLGRHRLNLCLMTLAVFALLVGPWVFRNYRLTHTAFGAAEYAACANTTYFPDYRLERSLTPDMERVWYVQLWDKFVDNTKTILRDDLPKIGGSWISAFFLVGLLIHFKDPSRSRMRYFLVLCLPFLIAAQAIGQTQLTEDNPVVNSENLLVFAGPLVIIFGVSLFFILLDQMNLPPPVLPLRYLITGIFCAVICAPAIVTFVSPRVRAPAFPPYDPPLIQRVSNWMQPDELLMSDVPWAVAWYGRRQCLWLTLNSKSDFFAVYDYQKPIKGIYLTPVTMDSRFLSQWVRGGDYNWGSFVLESTVKKQFPEYFPLIWSPTGFLPDEFFLTDTERWAKPPAVAPPAK